MDASTLILVGVFGTALALVTVGGIRWQKALPAFAPASVSATTVAPHPPLRLPTLSASLPSTQDIIADGPPASALARYLDGPTTDLVYEIMMQNARIEAIADDNDRRILIQRLHSLRRRIMAVFWNMHVLFRQEAAAETDVVIDRNVAAALDTSLRDLIRALEILPPADAAFHALAQHPARADFAAAVGALTLWLRDTRAAFRPQYAAVRKSERPRMSAAG